MTLGAARAPLLAYVVGPGPAALKVLAHHLITLGPEPLLEQALQLVERMPGQCEQRTQPDHIGHRLRAAVLLRNL